VFISEASREFTTFEVVHNQIVNPTFNPKMFKEVIKGAPTFPKEGKTQESPWVGVPLFLS
jgi:hypothetical protein